MCLKTQENPGWYPTTKWMNSGKSLHFPLCSKNEYISGKVQGGVPWERMDTIKQKSLDGSIFWSKNEDCLGTFLSHQPKPTVYHWLIVASAAKNGETTGPQKNEVRKVRTVGKGLPSMWTQTSKYTRVKVDGWVDLSFRY